MYAADKNGLYKLYLRYFICAVLGSGPPDDVGDHDKSVHDLRAMAFGSTDGAALRADPAAAYTDRDPSCADATAPVSLPVDIETLWKRVQG